MRLFIFFSVYFCLMSLANAEEINLTFGVYTSDRPVVLVKKHRPTLAYLEKKITEFSDSSTKIKIHVSKTYETGMNDLLTGKVDFARFGPASYVTAKRLNPDIELLAIEEIKGNRHFNGVIITRANGEIDNIHSLNKKRFAFGNSNSTIGRYLAQAYLAENKIFSTSLSGWAYHDRHDQVAYAVSQGEYDAGSLKEKTYLRLKADGLPLKILTTFENITKPWVARPGLDQRLLSLIKQAMFSSTTDGSWPVKNKFKLVDVNDSEYDPIRQAMEASKRFHK